MKICPKCRYLDHEENGPSYECPMCGVIYSKAIYTINKEKIRRNETEFQNSAWNKRNQSQIFSSKWIWVMLIAAASIITAINMKGAVNVESSLPVMPTVTMPQKSEAIFVTKYEMRTAEPLDCDFELISNDAPNTIFILLDPSKSQKKVLVYVRRGDSIKIKIPAGDYAYQMIQGENWIGEKEHFGPRTLYRDGEKIFTFYKSERGASGSQITLNTIDGNMHPTRTTKISLN